MNSPNPHLCCRWLDEDVASIWVQDLSIKEQTTGPGQEQDASGHIRVVTRTTWPYISTGLSKQDHGVVPAGFDICTSSFDF